MFLRNAWYVAAGRDELRDKLVARTVLNEPIVLGRDKAGNVFALEDRCCHRGAPLSLGWIGEGGLVCGYHGLVFDQNGTCVEIPGGGRIPREARVRSYPVVERGDFVWLWTGDPTCADARQVLEYPPDDAMEWPRRYGSLRVKANYVFLLENLMDLSHLSYLHRNSIGSSPEDSAQAKTEVQKTPTGVRFLRVMLNATPGKDRIAQHGFSGKIDRWSDFEFVAPSSVVQWSGMVEAGQYAKGDRTSGHGNRILHAITPETERSCHYFFSIGERYSKFETPGSRPATVRIPRMEIFEEDAFMLEQQQLRLEGYDRTSLVNIPSDIVRVHMVRFLEERIREEQIAGSRAAERR
jgi:vanillate O-demethylase monooxygenase subunit